MESIYLFFYEKTQMKLSKYIFQYCTLLTITLGSCQNKNQVAKDEIAQVQTSKGLLPIVTPGSSSNALPSNYLTTKQQQIEKFYNKTWSKNSMNGGFLVAKEGHVLFEKYQGVASKEKKTEITSETPIHIASVSKVFTATAILKLVDGGKLQLENKVTDFFPSFPYAKITVRTLLNHRSGLKNYAYFTNRKEVWDSHKTLTNQDVLNILTKYKIPLEFATDTRFSYSNTNYALLALIIEK